jgi:hypothetical protein
MGQHILAETGTVLWWLSVFGLWLMNMCKIRARNYFDLKVCDHILI